MRTYLVAFRKLALASLLTLGFSSTALLANDQDQDDQDVLNPPKGDISQHIPESCLLDQIMCLKDYKHLEVVKKIINIFSMKKGGTIVFTTEKYEEILAKMREVKITAAELEGFKKDHKQCISKLMPIIELVAKSAEVPVNQELIDEFCEKASLLYTTVSYMQNLFGAVVSSPGSSTLLFASVGAFGLNYLKGGNLQTGAKTAVMMSVFGLLFSNYFTGHPTQK